jgi:DNA (cytosine-5)-methyltransferase 1
LFRIDSSAQHQTDSEDRSGTASFSSKVHGQVAGLFAGIGGLEEGFRRQGFKSVLLCEIDPAARKVLEAHFPETQLKEDVNKLGAIPACTVLTAGFPCQDLSQVGRRKGIDGPNSGLIWKVLELVGGMPTAPDWLVLENVPFMLKLERGRAIAAIVEKLELMGFSWAYRTVDARAFGLPQRRRRVLLLASKKYDPRAALLGEDAGQPAIGFRHNAARGFYWTEGNTGIGWAESAIPPLKGGSSVHIPSAPAIWFPQKRTFITPDIRDAERLQGFPADWTKPAEMEKCGRRQRWRLVGNAVCVAMAEWLASRLSVRASFDEPDHEALNDGTAWPAAAWGRDGRRGRSNVSEWPVRREYQHLSSFLRYAGSPLSQKAAGGFLFRLERSQLRYDAQFAADLRQYVKAEE